MPAGRNRRCGGKLRRILSGGATGVNVAVAIDVGVDGRGDGDGSGPAKDCSSFGQGAVTSILKKGGKGKRMGLERGAGFAESGRAGDSDSVEEGKVLGNVLSLSRGKSCGGNGFGCTNYNSVSFTLCLSFITTITCVSLSHQQSFSSFAPTSEEWDSSFRSGSYGNGYTCVATPANFTLCKNIGYTNMMIPNLLGHDSLQEAEYHAKSWVPLLGLQCHPDTQLFLCSLFSPICLDRPIYPCRSLCLGVQQKCEPRMLTYKYPWPSMLKCDQFPEDHDLCIRPGAANNSENIDEPDCPACNQAQTCENIVDNFCRADFVFRAKYKRSRGSNLEFRKARWFKPREGQRKGREFRSMGLEPKDNCCTSKMRPGLPYIVMGNKRGGNNVVTFVMQWNGKEKVLKNAVRTFRSMDCSNPLPMSVIAGGGGEANSNRTGATGIRRKRRKQRQNDGKRRGKPNGGCRVSTSPQLSQ